MSVTHELKTHTEYLDAVASGAKSFEIRRDDRPYQVGDVLILRGYCPVTASYTGWELTKSITYVLRDVPQFGLMDGYCILGLGEL